MIVQCKEEIRQIGKWILSPHFIYLLFMFMYMFIMFTYACVLLYICLWVKHNLYESARQMYVHRRVLIISECLQACLSALKRREGLWNYTYAGMLMICKPLQPLFRTEFERMLYYHKFSENRQPGRWEVKNMNVTAGKRARSTAVLWIRLCCTSVKKLI